MKRRYNATGVDMNTGFTAAPDGFYDLVIRKVTDTKDGGPWKTKNGDDYVSVECEIDSGEFIGKKVWYGVCIMEPGKKGAGMALHFLKTIGEPWEGDFEIDTDNWIGKTFKVKLRATTDNMGRPRNEVAFICDPKFGGDEVPF